MNPTTTLPILAFIALVAAAPARAQVPSILNYQGRVTVGGTNLTTNGARFKFALVNSNGSTVYWRNDGSTAAGEPSTAVSVAVVQGLYSTLLGDTTLSNMAAIPSSAFTNENVNLRVWFSGGGTNPFVQLTPDQRIGAAGYALRAAVADATAVTNVAGNLNVAGTLTAGSIVAGSNNAAGGPQSAIIAGAANTNDGFASLIAAGQSNKVTSFAFNAFIGGGLANVSSGAQAVIGGGTANTNSAAGGFIGAGQSNNIASAATNAVIGGGDRNTANGRFGTIAGGYINTASNVGSTIGGGGRNTTASDWATVAGGYSNTASGYAGAVGGGWQNKASGSRATVAGGQLNTNGGPYSFIGGGVSNVVVESESFVSSHATIGGGLGNVVNTLSSYATISGGAANSVNAAHAVIGGGGANSNSSLYGTIGGGLGNYAEGEYNTVAGGYLNRIDQYDAVPNYATVSGGFNNSANGEYAAVPGGYMNRAFGDYSFAAGRRARADYHGSFVWADSQDEDFSAFFKDTFNVRAKYGSHFKGGQFVVTTGSGVFFESPTNNSVYWTPGDSDWTFTSDAASKENFRDVDPRDMLRRVAALPITEWNYIGYTQRNIGPTAQDWQKAFSEFSRSDKSINSGHMQGVALAAIKGLAEELKDRDKMIEELKAKSAELDVLKSEFRTLRDQVQSVLPPAP